MICHLPNKLRCVIFPRYHSFSQLSGWKRIASERHFSSSIYDSEIIGREDQRKLAKKLLTHLSESSEDHKYFRELQRVRKDLDLVIKDVDELEQIVDDEELRQLAVQDLEALDETISQLIERSCRLLLPGRDFDSSNSVLEVMAGAGGGEAAVFAQQIFEFYVKYANSLGYTISSIETEVPPGSNVGLQKATAAIRGQLVFRNLKYECGVHRVQRVPLAGTKNDRLQTSTCSVAVLPEPFDEDITLMDSDLKFEFMRSSGPGGQNVNTNDTACRVTHIPTNTSIKVQEERSQALNKKKAIQKLKTLLFQQKFDQEMALISRSRKTQIGNMNRNEKIRTYNYSRNMITDHRIGKSKQVPRLDQFLEGDNGFEVIEYFKDKLQKTEDIVNLTDLFPK